MPVSVTYPGVYITEPQGSQSITPVATNICAFVGRAILGPADAPITIFSYGDYTRVFGGLQQEFPLSYAVQDFFDNGGMQAIIVRLFEADADTHTDGIARLKFPSSGLQLRAASPGEWGNRLTALVDLNGITASSALAFEEYEISQNDVFNLTLTCVELNGQTIATERFLNVAVKTTGKSAQFPNRLDSVLQDQSTLARVDMLSTQPPANTSAATGVGGNDGTYLSPTSYLGDRELKTGIYMLEQVDIFNLLCIPPDRRIFTEVLEGQEDLDADVRQAATSYCFERRAFFILDPPSSWVTSAQNGQISTIAPDDLQIDEEVARNAAVYFPRIWKADVLMPSQPALFAACGAIAGVIAATDVSRGVWKAPAGINARLDGVLKLEIDLTDAQSGQLNAAGINCLRSFPTVGPVVWGARTLRGADQLNDDYKYIPVRRLALFIEESVYRGTQWAVFEPNDETLWSTLRRTVGAFLTDLWRQGAFYKYNVICDATTTTAHDIDAGVCNILIQFAPVKPGEFLVIGIQQRAGS